MAELTISEVSDGVEFDVLAKPRARKDGVVGVHDGALRVGVTVAPEKGLANAAIVKVLARLLDVPRSRISIVRGKKSRRKRIRAEGVTAEAVRHAADVKEPPG